MKFEFPNKYKTDNLVVTNEGKVWAYFRLEGYNYEFADDDEKKMNFFRQVAFLENLGLDFHALSLPNPTDITAIINRTIEEMKIKDYALKEYGIEVMRLTAEHLEKVNETTESSEYYDYIGIQLDPRKNKYSAVNVGLAAINSVKAFIQGFNSPLYQAFGLYPSDILESEIEAYKSQNPSLEVALSNAFSCKVKRVSFAELIYITEKNFSTRNNNSDIKIRKDYYIGKQVEGIDREGKKHKAYRSTSKEFLPLQDVNIDEFSPKELLISRVDNETNKIEELYVQHLIVESMPDVSYHPGSELLYYIKTYMPFPVSTSIRANCIPNELVKKKLGNSKLEIQDQRVEALKGGQNVDMNVDVAESGTTQLENYFTQTGYPGYSCSIVFKVTGVTRQQLETRVNILRDELSKFKVKIISPYGEQLSLFTEFIPGGKRVNGDYNIEAAPTVLAGLMFGATTNIGDNRGFYIGDTLDIGKPVFIQSDLAAKAFKGLGNIVDSLAVLVAGMTGKGKSFFMNLFTYLSVLTGSTALIIDPKGDRKKWEHGLPAIPKEYISVWTLGEKESDAGALDPFRTSITIEEGKQVAMDILAFLGQLTMQNPAYSELADAVENAATKEDPCIQLVLDYLVERRNTARHELSSNGFESLDQFVNTLLTLKKNNLSRLLFGEVGQSYKSLNHKTPLQVLMIQNLTLPTEKDKHNKRPIHYMSEAIMISITAWTKEYMIKGDRYVHKIILQDEANVIERNPMGAVLLDTIVRQGRSYNTTLLKGAQNASDHGSNVSNMGMRFSFGLRKTDEAKEMLDYLNLPPTEENINMLKGLEKGHAIFQDIYGRTARIQINPIFEELYDAFDSSTSTKEEREREEARVNI